MGEASDNSLTYLTAGDIRSLVVYMRSVPAQSTDLPRTVTTAAPASHREGPATDVDDRDQAEADGKGRQYHGKFPRGRHGRGEKLTYCCATCLRKDRMFLAVNLAPWAPKRAVT